MFGGGIVVLGFLMIRDDAFDIRRGVNIRTSNNIDHHLGSVRYIGRWYFPSDVDISVFLGHAYDVFLWGDVWKGKKPGLEICRAMLDGVVIYLASDVVSMVAKHAMDVDLFVLA